MKQCVRVFVSVLLLGIVMWWVQPHAALSALARPHPGWLALSIAALVAQIGLSALRWQLTARAIGQALPRLWAVQEYALSVAANTFLPGGVLGDLGNRRAAGRDRQHSVWPGLHGGGAAGFAPPACTTQARLDA